MKKCSSCGHDNGSSRCVCVECDAQLPATVWIMPARVSSSRWTLPFPASTTIPMNAQDAQWAWRLAQLSQPKAVSYANRVFEETEAHRRTGGTRALKSAFVPRLLGFLRDEANRLALDPIRRVVESGWRIAGAPPVAFTRPS
jgi:hypothetical protein